MSYVEGWMARMNNEERFKFACLTMFMGEEKVASELVKCNDINLLFSSVAERVYTHQ